jgi:hypothetical protein
MVSCDMEDGVKEDPFMREGRLISALWKGVEVYPKSNASSELFTKCDLRVKTPTALLMRFEAWNLYHQLGEAINTFVSLVVKSIAQHNVTQYNTIQYNTNNTTQHNTV